MADCSVSQTNLLWLICSKRSDVPELLGDRQFAISTDDDLGTLASRLGLGVTNARSVNAGRVAVADHSTTYEPETSG